MEDKSRRFQPRKLNLTQLDDRIKDQLNTRMPNRNKSQFKSPRLSRGLRKESPAYRMSQEKSLGSQISSPSALIFLFGLAVGLFGRPLESVAEVTNWHSTRNVTDLRLTPDFRSVKLRWLYKEADQNQNHKPIAFLVSHCELTSWNVEIKCRDRNLMVASDHNESANRSSSDENLPVIKWKPQSSSLSDKVTQLSGSQYEAQIYDLRALTNYTFQVRVSQFEGESPMPLNVSGTRNSAARRLSFESSQQSNQIDRVETKAFRAEATKCLSDVSEVVVNTGPYFAGRISVENSADPRCSITGNKSSQQVNYLFRIEHQICDSKVIDGNRIETMILVHENKDILTHNTARFLVLCNFSQKSFTLRASISLPKVQSLLRPINNRAAVISPLARKPNKQELMAAGDVAMDALLADTSAKDDFAPMPVMLGSMPGTYHQRMRDNSSPEELSSANIANIAEQSSAKANEKQDSGEPLNAIQGEKKLTDWKQYSGQQVDAATTTTTTTYANANQLNELESNIIETFTKNASRDSPRKSKELPDNRVNLSSETHEARRWSWASSDQPLVARSHSSANTRAITTPRPLDVRSKALYVLPGGHFRDPATGAALATVISANISKSVSSGETRDATDGRSLSSVISQRDIKQSTELADDLRATPIVMTNNHRVSADYVPLTQSMTPRIDNSANQDQSIRYSTQQVDELPIAADMSRNHRNRSARMRSVDEIDSRSMAHPTYLPDKQSNQQIHLTTWTSPVSRMGEMKANDLLPEADSTHENKTLLSNSNNSTTSPTLAQNITSYLLKWSLKTLTNLAKKSLESLAHDERGANETGDRLIMTSLAPESARSSGGFATNSKQSIQIDTNKITPKAAARDLQVTNIHSAQVNSAINGTTTGVRLEQTKLVDDFLTTTSGGGSTKRRVGDQPAGAQVSTSTSRMPSIAGIRVEKKTHQPTRAANYSKSIDFDKSNSSDTKVTKSQPKSVINLKPDSSAHQTITSNSDELNKRSRLDSLVSWFFYGFILVVSLGAIVVFTFWLVFAPVGLSGSSGRINNLNCQTNDLHSKFYGIAGATGCTNPLVIEADGHYQKYGFRREDVSCDSMGRLRVQSPTNSSQVTTRSISTSSTPSGNENDCKNQEFLCSGHVLIDPAKSPGESFA